MRRSVPRRALVLGLPLVIAVLAGSPVAPAVADPGCTGLMAPVAGPVLRSFAPIGSYAGHWGVDLGASPGTPVGSAGTGVVSFAGTVVDLLTVTVDHGGGLRTSYSYLGSVAVGVGAPVAPHTLIGTSGVDNGIEAVHFSVRVGAEYLDPEPWLRCLPPGPALSLTTDDLATAGAAPVPAVTAPYAGPGATRHPRRHVRPSPRRPSRRRRDRLPATRPRRGHPDAGRGPVAEGRPAGQRPGPPPRHDGACRRRRGVLRGRRPRGPPPGPDLHHRDDRVVPGGRRHRAHSRSRRRRRPGRLAPGRRGAGARIVRA